MRSWVVFVTMAALTTGLLSAGSAESADDVGPLIDEVSDTVPLPDSLRFSDAQAADPAAESSSHASAASAGMVGAVLVGPARIVSQSLIDLGLQLLQAMFAGVREGAHAYAGAAEAVLAHPVQAAGIAASTFLLIGLGSALAGGLERYGSLGALPLFSRIAKSDLLANGVRSQIFDLIKANPGINVSEISRSLDIAWGTTTHHLGKLRQDRLVAIRVESNRKCYFPNGGTYTNHEMDLMAATQNATARRIADYLVQWGPRCHKHIVNDLGVSPALVSFHMEKLVRAGVVARQRQGRMTIFTPLAATLDPAPRPASHL